VRDREVNWNYSHKTGIHLGTADHASQRQKRITSSSRTKRNPDYKSRTIKRLDVAISLSRYQKSNHLRHRPSEGVIAG
jgi:hypothetical protein